MTAQILDGRIVRDFVARELTKEVKETKNKYSIPRLVIIQIGDLEESNVYVSQKVKFGKIIGAAVDIRIFPKDVNQGKIEVELDKLNEDKTVHGIIIQQPVPDQIYLPMLIEQVNPLKDVDGQTAQNIKYLFEKNPLGYIPATTLGIMRLLGYYKIPVQGRKVVIVGRSFLVGRPTALAFINLDATVTVCHSWTKNLAAETKRADILIVAIGKPNLIGKEHVSPNQVIIDVGINVIDFNPDEPSTINHKRSLVGDVNFEEVSPIVSAITPVPGGVGPMTVASLFENLLEAYKKQTT